MFIISNLLILFFIISPIRAQEPIPTKTESPPIVSCKLNQEKYSNVLEIIKFDSKYVKHFEATSELQHAQFIKIGSITKGPCAGGDLYKVVIDVLAACGKTGGQSDEIFADDHIYEPSEKFIFPDCHRAFHAVKLENKAIFFGYYPSLDSEIINKLKERANISIVVTDETMTWAQVLFPNAKVKIDTKEYLIKSPEYSTTFDENSFKKEAEVVRKLKLLKTLPGPIKLYQDGRQIILETPDQLFTNAVDLGLFINPPSGYTFITYWDSFAKKNKLSDKNLFNNQDGGNFVIDPKSSFIKKSYDVYIKNMKAIYWDQYKFIKSTPPIKYKDFIYSKPFLVMTDPFGQKQVFKKSLLTLPAMSEPLIYLYSNKPINVKIKLSPKIELTRTNPDYPGQWNVQIVPPNQIKDLSTDRHYSSLFWEGRSFLTPPWEEGWIVKRSDIKTFLDRMLEEQGLNQLEAKEFKRYWVPRMQKSPYYKIRFFSEEFLNFYAPLLIEPNPDVLIRVHMDFHPIDQSEELKMPEKRILPKRTGFTFVEWSGFTYQFQN